MRHFLFASVTIVGISVSVLVAAGTAPSVVKTTEQAVAIGIAACDGSFGKRTRANGVASDMQVLHWHAQLVEDHWHVWSELDSEGSGMQIDIQRNGQPPSPENCEIIVTTHERQRHQ
jgi:hypothetical protein